MHLYEVTNMRMGESYVRVYVWCENDDQVIDLALQAFGLAVYSDVIVSKLFSADEPPFVTKPSDSGFER